MTEPAGAGGAVGCSPGSERPEEPPKSQEAEAQARRAPQGGPESMQRDDKKTGLGHTWRKCLSAHRGVAVTDPPSPLLAAAQSLLPLNPHGHLWGHRRLRPTPQIRKGGPAGPRGFLHCHTWQVSLTPQPSLPLQGSPLWAGAGLHPGWAQEAGLWTPPSWTPETPSRPSDAPTEGQPLSRRGPAPVPPVLVTGQLPRGATLRMRKLQGDGVISN
ncbi:PREDICTED: uncharacterized protein LOC102006044 [Chinchilla lanigera]|uniref:uncharacterized protein LOC102006044 n=1 Tax=Chinchilla lanigera TaxID=34839 RepID=UPI000698EAF2|nr:PREDICTED: uncharacterized protein LOC102006044 [Chinchilla lanigera]